MAFTNKRIFWAVQAAGIADRGSVNYTEIHGLQSIGITTTFNLEQVFEIGQIAIYENIEEIPDVEVTLEKVLDGYPLIYHLATKGFSTPTLTGRSNQKPQVALSIFGDVQDSASGVPLTELIMSGLFVSSLGYNIPVEGNTTESVTMIGNNKEWRSAGFDFTGTIFDNTDQPLSETSGTGGVQRRENVVFTATSATRDVNGAVDDEETTILPTEVDGISSSGTNDQNSDGDFASHIQSINITADLGRDPIFELGRKAPYHRFVTFPVEVTTDIEIISLLGDQIDVVEDEDNLTNNTIKVKMEEGSFFDLGTKNKAASMTIGGGDTGGDNQTITYSFSTFNDLTVTHQLDPTVTN